ncbi:MAG: bifunctional methylenetetrahydrofolate dehydrogenase/methenyltetrahydrofolate cyclohydrolase FolD [Bdellovibrionales bacterium]
MKILDGKEVAHVRRTRLRERVNKLQRTKGRAPGLAVILVGDDPASQVYVAHKIKACAEAGIQSFEHRLSATVTAHELRLTIEGLNENPLVDGVLLQLPLPGHLDAEEAIAWIAPAKDADCLTPANLGRLWMGRPLTTPCTPWGVMAILEHYGISPEGRHAVVVGRSNIVGKPMAHLLLRANATVTVCHSRTKDLKAFTRAADIVVVAAGKPEFLGLGDFKAGGVVIDVGIHRKPSTVEGAKSRLCGDVRLKEIEDVIAAGTPVPGGVGPMTITMLLENTLCLAEAGSP